MRATARRTATVIATVALSTLMALPAVTASAAPAAPVPASSRVEAVLQLRADIRAANQAYRTAIMAARRSFNLNAAVRDALKVRNDSIAAAVAVYEASAKSPADRAALEAAREAAQAAFRSAVQVPIDARRAAYDSAQASWRAAIDTAFATYDGAVQSNREAALAFREAMASARTAYVVRVRAANVKLRADTAANRSALMSALSAARTTFQASDKGPEAVAAYEAAVRTALNTYNRQAAVRAALTVRQAHLVDARADYRDAVTAAREAFWAATGRATTVPTTALPVV